MFGFLVVDKPRGVTSRTTLDRIWRLIKPVKAGHAGTLDPLATGVLVVCLGPATRLVSLIQCMPKSYLASFRLGFESETEDTASTLIPVPGATDVTETALVEILPKFHGIISQKPPLYSALRFNGRRAYDLARAGRAFDLQPREVSVHRLQLQNFADGEFEVNIECGSGTYVRSLGRDLGRALGSGAVMTSLRRTAVGPFNLEQAAELNLWDENADGSVLSDQLISPIEALSNGLGLSQIRLLESDVQDLCHGRKLKSLGLRLSEQVIDCNGLFMGIDDLGRLIAVLKQNSETRQVTFAVNFARHWYP